MAVVAAPLLLGGSTGALATSLGAVGFALTSAVVVAGAAYVDQRYVMPGLLGRSKDRGRQDKIFGVPVGSNDPGAPRILAFGRRVRVPAHIAWQSDKVRSDTARNSKGGAIQQRKVEISCALIFNDRLTRRLEQLRGNDALLIARTTNLIDVISDAMTVVAVGSNVKVSMSSLDDPDFSDKFAVDDYVRCFDFVAVSGSVAELQRGQWKVINVKAHSAATPSSMTLAPASTQVATGINAAGGNSAAPARIERQDNQIAGWQTVQITNVASRRRFVFAKVWPAVSSSDPHYEFIDLVNENILPNLTVEIREYQILGSGAGTFQREIIYTSTVRYTGMDPTQTVAYRVPFVEIDLAAMTTVTIDSPPAGSGIVKSHNTIRVINPLGVNLFPNGFNPDDRFYSGTETQLPDSLLEANIGVGSTPFFRGMCYQVLDRLQVTQFGDSLPFSLEGLLSVDVGFTNQDAIRLLCEYGGLAPEFVNTDGVTPRPELGGYIRGTVPGLTNLMPLLIREQVTTQDRNGVIYFMDLDAADIVPVTNNALVSDFGAVVGTTRSQEPNLKWNKPTPSDLPRFVGIRHQDSDNQFADGFQPFGLRNPNATEEQNEQEINLTQLVMPRKTAKALATTLLRRAHINATGVNYTLTAQYLDLLEGDIQTFLDETGTSRMVRVMRRDVGTNYLVKVEADLEQLNLKVLNPSVQIPVTPPPQLVVPIPIDGYLLDIPGLRDGDVSERSIYAIATSGEGTNWNGCYVYLSTDGDVTWKQIGYVSHQANIGTLTSTLAPGAAAETYGTELLTYQIGFFAVQFDNPDAVGTLVSVDQAVEYGQNWFLIVAPDGRTEIIGVRDVVQTSSTEFFFVNLLRGLRGTWPSCSTAFPIGSRIYSIDSILASVTVRFPNAVPSGPVSIRFVPPGRSLADVGSVAIVPSWKNVIPLPLRVLDKAIGSSPFDVRFTTENWTRRVSTLGVLPPYPMDEDVEAYRFTIYDPTGTFVVRTKTVTAQGTGSPFLVTKSVTYSATEQIADGYTPSGSTTFWVGVQQLGTFGESQLVKRNV